MLVFKNVFLLVAQTIVVFYNKAALSNWTKVYSSIYIRHTFLLKIYIPHDHLRFCVFIYFERKPNLK